MPPQVFISHCHEDKAVFSSLCLAFDGSGIDHWDTNSMAAGDALADRLSSAIAQCGICVFVATERSLKSSWCMAELGAFWGSGKKVILYVADPDIGGNDLPPQFRGTLSTSDTAKVMRDVQSAIAKLERQAREGLAVQFGQLKVRVHFGRLEEFENADKNCVVALPANEYFDDECIDDSRSALGAFIQHRVQNRVSEIRDLVQAQLAQVPTERVEKTPGTFANSYGIGTCAYLEEPLSLNLRVAMVAVTTQRADIGLRADASYIFIAMETLCRLMANHRLSKLNIPIIGSGHGGLKPEVALTTMLLALSEIGRRGSPNIAREVNIIVFQGDVTQEPAISVASVKRAVDFAGRVLA